MDQIISLHRANLGKLLLTTPIAFDGNLRSRLPSSGGVYRISEIGSEWFSSVYVGQSIDIQNRIYTAHLMGNRSASTLKRKLIARGIFIHESEVKKYLQQKCCLQFLQIEDENERNFFEHFAIAILKPLYND